jgi:hypothetical protein
MIVLGVAALLGAGAVDFATLEHLTTMASYGIFDLVEVVMRGLCFKYETDLVLFPYLRVQFKTNARLIASASARQPRQLCN